MFEIIQTNTKDNLNLHGLYIKGDKNKPVIIHVHGFQGDFFTNGFIQPLAQKLKENGYGFLSIQTRGMASEYLLNTRDGSWKQYGSHFELHEEAYIDVDSWIEFLEKEGYTEIILQGHSLGTLKIIRYLFEGSYSEKVKKLILLAPFDNIYMAESYTKGKWREYLKLAKQKVAEGHENEIIPKEWWDIAPSYKTYISWLDDNDFTHMFDFYDKSYSFPALNKIEIPVHVIVGSKDEFFHTSNPENPEEAIDILRKNIKDFSYNLVENAKHSFGGYEENIIKHILNLITSSP